MTQNTFELNVPDMTCGHCVGAVTRAIKDQDPAANVTITLADKLVVVETAESREEIVVCVVEAGYSVI